MGIVLPSMIPEKPPEAIRFLTPQQSHAILPPYKTGTLKIIDPVHLLSLCSSALHKLSPGLPQVGELPASLKLTLDSVSTSRWIIFRKYHSEYSSSAPLQFTIPPGLCPSACRTSSRWEVEQHHAKYRLQPLPGCYLVCSEVRNHKPGALRNFYCTLTLLQHPSVFSVIVVFILSALWWIRIRGLWKLPDGRDWRENWVLFWWAGLCSLPVVWPETKLWGR